MYLDKQGLQFNEQLNLIGWLVLLVNFYILSDRVLHVALCCSQ